MTLSEALELLRRPVEDTYLDKKNAGSGTMVDYLPHWNACAVADERGIEWSTEVVRMDLVAYTGWFNETVKDGNTTTKRRVQRPSQRLIVVVRITVVGSDGSTWRESTGWCDVNHDGYGDPSSNAEAMARTRAWALHGLGRQLKVTDDAFSAIYEPPAGNGHEPPAAAPAGIDTATGEVVGRATPPPAKAAAKGAAPRPRAVAVISREISNTVDPGHLLGNIKPEIEAMSDGPNKAGLRKHLASRLLELGQPAPES